MDLNERVRVLEAKWEILQLIGSYGPAVDAGRARAVADLFAADGRYTYSLNGEQHTLTGNDELVGMVEGPTHQGIIAGGAGHVLDLPRVVVDGDRAVATGHSLLTRFEADTGRWYLDRVASNRWECERTDAGWKVVNRVNELLDGREESRDLLAAAEQTEAWA